MLFNESDRLLERSIDESNATFASEQETKDRARCYRRVASVERHQTWVAVVSAGATLAVAVPSVSELLSVYSGILTSWTGL